MDIGELKMQVEMPKFSRLVILLAAVLAVASERLVTWATNRCKCRLIKGSG